MSAGLIPEAPASAEKVQIRRAALEDARRAAVRAVMSTGIGRAAAITEAPACHKAKCWCDSDTQVERLVDLILKCAADEVTRALILEWDEDAARLDHMVDAWDEGYMHVMQHGTGRNTRGMNPYLLTAAELDGAR